VIEVCVDFVVANIAELTEGNSGDAENAYTMELLRIDVVNTRRAVILTSCP
jgi:hypothetical protein